MKRLVLLVALLAPVAQAQAMPKTHPVSVNSSGQLGRGNTLGSGEPALSRDGRFVVFYSYSRNLVPGDRNGSADVFRHDRRTGRTRIVSVTSDEKLVDEGGDTPSISAKGRYVAFTSYSNELVDGDTNETQCSPSDEECQSEPATDVFVRDVKRGRTSRVSLSNTGKQGNGSSSLATISGNGRYVVFGSRADNLVEGDSNDEYDLFIRDRKLKTTERVSVGDDEKEPNGSVLFFDVSHDGRYVAFSSDAGNLAAGDTDKSEDVFLRDRELGTTTLLTPGVSNPDLGGVSISDSGRVVSFVIGAALDPADTNKKRDVYVWTASGGAERASLGRGGEQIDDESYLGAISGDGRWVAWNTEADVVGKDSNDGLLDVFMRNLASGKVRRVSVGGDSYSSEPALDEEARWVAFQSASTTFTEKNTRKSAQIYLRGPF